MTINLTPLESKFGFKAPGFSVDASGNLIASSVQANSFTSDGAAITLGNIVLQDNFIAEVFVNSSIGTVDNTDLHFSSNLVLEEGTIKYNLTAKNVYAQKLIGSSGNLSIETTDAPIFLKSNFRVAVQTSPLQLAQYEEVDRDAIIPADGDLVFNSDTSSINFYNGSDWQNINGMGNISVTGTTMSAGTAEDISIIPQTGGTVIVNDLVINNLPIENEQATRKDYVDRRIAAFAIAFGA
jgi:hypothetical protein